MKPYIEILGGFLEQAGKLQLGGTHGRIRHIIDQADMHGGAQTALTECEILDAGKFLFHHPALR